MKRALIILLLAFSGCSVWDNQAGCPEPLLSVIFTPGEETRSPSEASESAVTHLSILLYREGTTLPYAFGSISGGSLPLSIDSGTYTVYAIVNFPSFTPTSSTRPSDIASMTSNLTDNSRSALVMSGSVKATISSSGTVAVPVLRHTSKVTLQSVSVDFSGTYLEGKSILLKKCYLSNVWGSCSFGAASSGAAPEATVPSARGSWYNLHGYSTSAADELIYAALSTTVADGTTCSDRQYFYCTPNPSTVRTSDALPCCTRLVLEVSVGDDENTCHYHIDLPGMSPNSAYAVSVSIGYYGGDSPESNLGRLDISAEVSVEDYTVSEMPVTL